MTRKKRIGIIGAGASGIACALFLKEKLDDTEVIIFEKNDRIAKKILKTGNGKCNLSNKNLDSTYYCSDFVEYSLNHFTNKQCVQFFRRMGIWTKYDEEGRMYPYSEKANTVVDGFLQALNEKEISFQTNYYVNHIKSADRFLVYSDTYQVENVDFLVFAMGSAASEKEECNYSLLTDMGHTFDNINPGLTSFITSTNTKPLAGIRIKAKVKLLKNDVLIQETVGEVLFKDQGLSGIAIMDLSNYYEKDSYVELDIAYDQVEEELTEFLSHDLEKRVFGLFPKMIAMDILKRTVTKNIAEVIYQIHHYRFDILHTAGMQQAQIAVGGLKKDEINPYTMESNKISNVYVIGELLGVGGKCGGYNLHFAWASGFVAAQDIIHKIKGE